MNSTVILNNLYELISSAKPGLEAVIGAGYITGDRQVPISGSEIALHKAVGAY